MPFNIYTAIDILDEKCVRLEQGDFSKSTVYNQNPIFQAKLWKQAGADYLHIVDLDGAKSGHGVNTGTIRKIVHDIGIKVQVGGGIRNMAMIERLLDVGTERVILGSAVIKDPEFAKEALQKFGGEKIVFGLDCRDGYIAVEGWLESSDKKAIDVINEFKEHGLKIVMFTDIARDGTLEGPNLQALSDLLANTDIKIIASGGVSNIEDVYKIKELGKIGNIDGVVIGKALYTNNIKANDLYDDLIYN